MSDPNVYSEWVDVVQRALDRDGQVSWDESRRLADVVASQLWNYVTSGNLAAPSPALDAALARERRLREAVTSEDEIAHGEAWTDVRGGLGVCAYCNGEWPCRTQRGINRALAETEAGS